MLVIALDTSTPAVTAGLVALDEGEPQVLAERVTINPRAHGELLMPQLVDVMGEAGRGFAEVDAIVAGTGPGPFTGLRVGLATAAALGQACDVPVHPVCSLDAIAAAAGVTGPLLVATDARRKETYWAVYDGDSRLDGPHVAKPADVPTEGYPVAAGELAEAVGLPAVQPQHPTPAGLVAAAALDADPAPLVPLYLRRPDADEPGKRKSVLTR
ncbi:tRNA (adenosine(37)-N6)-threonylcarbamoyltransferase complex dimerization subunit type 1 TsaB [Saccharopolyspora rhizosphaerae]|uniref:tRNA (Adenosine(37)-N6)-threonylcarbamoyltransferase complex dimerization subunit type 1 TsaB n=1 Tax=Saccharopolyspora rhizosphaerae TaxID=2492662 RepID=A0A3R8Q4G3_9PSEU|nr:tRNA (adenosine(37)-N6)-threonylcarbamoyltransferase complex dimerization subunit type 1 TsaB [Saccharopolyspora rhizosphaerae]RRO12890.1 tRNA (adenosine(37)-N6)-threonylcarbamoyltransferase complex dimerization subunit type 1 TsaB [Saccharopolyspora rhizosphaerae]